MSKSLGQSIIVENIGGGSIASQAVAKAAPDGYTLLVAYVGWTRSSIRSTSSALTP
ncbi:tripartite tricarboxylate transporter substrate-binding protein [Polynucleobacter necessarius]|uniref:tripartite tricarboxylate transporter substrate-binding protein n=1 Tax=Polynucleobacter necessarius TaxID=576610 RepID=UPI001E4EB4C5|nr:tripartite tricarboxylate transporter substrate-binding protein [Polynucleobacter necessarius]